MKLLAGVTSFSPCTAKSEAPESSSGTSSAGGVAVAGRSAQREPTQGKGVPGEEDWVEKLKAIEE